MVKKLFVIDYIEGAGGEFFANFINAHLKQQLKSDLQKEPGILQKWFNSQSLKNTDWNQNFNMYLEQFDKHCQEHNVENIAIAYHLYKWPHHVNLIRSYYDNVRFVKIIVDGYESFVKADFKRKVSDKFLTADNFDEVTYFLKDKPQDYVLHCLNLYKLGKLTYEDLVINRPTTINEKVLPSDDISIRYEDFFINFDNTLNAYKHLCEQLNLTPDIELLNSLVARNKENQEALHKYMSKT